MESVVKEVIGEETGHGQRIDNFLIKRLKGVPKSHIYQLLRSGQVRVNSKRIAADYRLQQGDTVRIPPVARANRSVDRETDKKTGRTGWVTFDVLFQDEALLVINKPAGIAVHGGSGIRLGVIEQLRMQYPDWKFLELVHRLDRETSGILLLAKKRLALIGLHQQIREGSIEKKYSVMVKGKWSHSRQNVKLPLVRYVTPDGERRVAVVTGNEADRKACNKKNATSGETAEGMYAHTVFTLKKSWGDFSLLEAELKTGRTHQIRVHLAHLGFPIIGDDKYGDFALNKALSRSGAVPGLKRMFLHASTSVLVHPVTSETLYLEAPLADDLQVFADMLDRRQSNIPTSQSG